MENFLKKKKKSFYIRNRIKLLNIGAWRAGHERVTFYGNIVYRPVIFFLEQL